MVRWRSRVFGFMSSMTTTSTAAFPNDSLQSSPLLRGGDDGESFYGLAPATWIKVAVVAILMATLFRFNLLRLWLKTNWYSGEANWAHSLIVPLIGIYYLYVNREELLKAKIQPVRITQWSRE